MRQSFIDVNPKGFLHLLSWIVFGLVSGPITQLSAQQSNLANNTYTPITATSPASFTNLSTATSSFGVGVTLTSYTGEANLINANRDDAASKRVTAVAGEHWIEVRDNAAASVGNQYPGGSFAGFVVDYSDLATYFTLQRTLGTVSVSVSTYLDNAPQESFSNSDLLFSNITNSNLATDRAVVGFVTSTAKPFNRIRFTLNGTTATDMDLYYAVVKKFAANNNELTCNTSTILDQATYPVAIDMAKTGVVGCLACIVANPNNAIDNDANTAATISAGVSLSGTASLAVKNQLQTYPAGTFAGFDFQTLSVATVNLLSSVSITLYQGGNVVQTSTNNTLLLGAAAVIGGNTRRTVGIVSTAIFDEVRISFTSVGADLGAISIYSAIIKRFCAGPTLVCSTSISTPLTTPTYPVYINGSNTGTGSSLICAGCTINNVENVIDGSSITPATITLGASASATARLSVANALDTYPAESFVGFDIESSTLLSVSLLGRTRITLYNNGSAVQTGSGASLLAGATLLSGSRQTIGTVAQVPFDEVEIEFEQLASANPLGTINVYRAVIQKACVTQVSCNQTKFLNNPEFSAFIEGTRTGFFGLGSLNLTGSSIENAGNVISSSTTDFARIRNVVSTSATAAISVADPADVYPAGTFAGFTISKANLPVSANLFSNLTVNTYLNGVLQESSATAGNLIDLSVFLQIFGGVPSGTLANVGFVTSKPFDEIQLSVGSFASAANFVDVYGAFIDTRYSVNAGGLVCNLNPDFDVTAKNVPVSGNVSTNDMGAPGTTYGTPTAAGSNPTGATITLNPGGTYNFIATTPGSYTYSVPACSIGQTNCPTTPLIITVLDPFVTTNPPVANPDYASVASSTATAGSVTVNVRANDGPGNPGGTLGTPTIVVPPAHGTATMDGSGNVVYVPATNYIGDDFLTYQLCESPGGLCSTAQVTVHVIAPGGNTVSVDDDYVKTNPKVAVTGNVLINDIGNGITVSTPTTSIATSGTLILTSTGSYTFTPAFGFTGPVAFTYTACDNSATAVCGTATLHVLVNPVPDLSPIIYARPSTIYNTSDITVVVDIIELNSAASSGQITVKMTKDPKVSLVFPPAATSIGNRPVQNSSWTLDNSDTHYYTLTTNQVIGAFNVLSFGFTGTLTPGQTTGAVSISAVIIGVTGEVNLGNNADADKVDYFQQ